MGFTSLRTSWPPLRSSHGNNCLSRSLKFCALAKSGNEHRLSSIGRAWDESLDIELFLWREVE